MAKSSTDSKKKNTGTTAGSGSKSATKKTIDIKDRSKAKKASEAKKAADFHPKKSNRSLYVLAFLIPVIAVLLGMLAGSFAPFGGKDVMTAGGHSQHLTYYYELYDRVHEGKGLLYSLTTGSGYDFTTIFTYYLSDPLNLIILIFPRTAILAVFNLLYALKIGLAGLFFAFFLNHRKERILQRKLAMEESRSDAIRAISERRAARKARAKEKAEKSGKTAKKDLVIGGAEAPSTGIGALLAKFDFPILGFSIAYALSAYMLGQGLNVGNLSVVAIFPILLMALDELMENGKWRLYAALMTACIFCSFQMAIVVFLFSVLYAILFDHKDLHHAIRNLLLKLLSDLMAFGAGAVIVLNCLGSTTFRDQVSVKFPYGGVVTTFFDIIKNLLPTTRTSATSAYSYGIDIFCGILAVFLVILYVLNPNIKLSRRLRQTGILAALGTGLMLVTPNYLFNGFSHREMTVCLFGFLFIAQLLSMAYEVFQNIEHTPVWQLHAALVVLLVLIPVSFFLCDNYNSFSPFLYAMEFLMGYYFLTLLYRSDNLGKWLLALLIPVILILEVGMTYVDNLRLAGSESKAYSSTMDSQYYEVSRLLHQAMPEAHIKIYDPETNQDTVVAYTLLDYHFIITSKDVKNVDPTLRHMTDVGDVSIYENEYSANGVFIPKSVEDWAYREEAPFTTTNDLILDVLDSTPVFYTALGEPSNGFLPKFDENGVEDVRHLDYMFNFVPEGDGPLYSSLYSIRFHGDVKKGELATFLHTFSSWEETPTTPRSEYVFFHKEGFEAFCKNLLIPASKIRSEGSVSYSIDAPEDGYLLLPYSTLSGWKISSSTNAAGTMDNFLGQALMVPVSSGQNTIELEYTPSLFYVGILISLACLAILIFLAVKDQLKIRATAGGIHSLSDWIRENYVYVITISVMALIYILMLMYTSSIPFGNKSVLIGDGYLQGYYGNAGIMKALKNGTYGPLDWNTGIAIDQYNSFLSYLLTPWTLLKYRIMPESMILFDMAFRYGLCFIFPSITILLYLTHRHGRKMNKKDWRLIVIGLSYGLSTYGISYFVYANFDFLSYVPLILLGLERLVYDKKPALYIILLFIMMGDAYYGFMLCEFLFLYFFTLKFDSFKDFIQKGLRFAAASIASAGLACFRLIPYFMRTLDSPYKAGDSISPLSKSGGNYLSVISDYMSHREAVITTTDDFRVNYYIGILALLVIPLYLLNKKVDLSVRIRRTVLLSLYFIAFGSSILNYVFHGFHYQTQVPNRFSAFFIVLLVIMFAECILSWQDYKRKTFCLSITIPAVILGILWTIALLSDLREPVKTTAYVMSMIILGIYIILACLQFLKKHKNALRNAMLVVLISEMILNAVYIFPNAIGATVPDDRDQNSINTLSARHPEMQEPFTATEFIADYYNIAESTDMISDSFFSSYSTNGHMTLFTKWNLLTSGNSTAYLTGNPLADMMMHIRYNISNNADDSSWSHYPVIDQSGCMVLHENPNFLPLGIYFADNEELAAWAKTEYSDYNEDQHGGNAFELQNAFSHAMGCGDLYHIIEPEADGSKINEENESEITYITADPSEYLEGKQTEIPTKIHLAKDVEGDVYFSYFNTISYAGTTTAGEADVFDMTMYLPLGRKDYYMRIATFDEEEMEKLHEKLAASTMQDIEIGFNSITGKITTPDSGTVYLSLPYMSGWTYYVDGSKVEGSEYLGGVGIPVTAGDHTIKVIYTPRGAWLGFAVTGATILLLIAYVLIRRKTAKRNPSPTTETDGGDSSETDSEKTVEI